MRLRILRERQHDTTTFARRLGWRVACSIALLVPLLPLAGKAEDDGAKDVWEALTQGKPTLNVRGRIEVAQAGALNQSEAYTLRTHLGYGTKPYHGARLYAQFENVATPSTTTYFDPTRPPNSLNNTPIADPQGTELNQGFFELNRPDWLGSKLVGGRQRIVFDDARFIGDVVWRQNQQTYDSLYFQSSAGVDGLMVRYGYLGSVKRIFGGGGANPNLGDFDSNSHIVNVSYNQIPQARLVAFAYFLDLKQPGATAPPARFSNQTFGVRATGTIGLAEKLDLVYQGSYAYQEDYGDKLPDYAAHYGLADVNLAVSGIVAIGGGYEHLGTDDGNQQFITILSTAHKFNGWADVFLDNGGPGGLRNAYAYVAPKLPWKIKSKLIYHRFWADVDGASFGNEFNAVLKRAFGKHLDLLFKAAYFVADKGSPRPTTYRVWFDVTVKF